MTFTEIFSIILVHFIADFLLQSEKMATNKNHSINWLTIHVAIYTFCFLVFGFKFAIINGIAHWVTDYITSKWCTKLYKAGRIRSFFKVIGLDQTLHFIALFGSYFLLKC